MQETQCGRQRQRRFSNLCLTQENNVARTTSSERTTEVGGAVDGVLGPSDRVQVVALLFDVSKGM